MQHWQHCNSIMCVQLAKSKAISFEMCIHFKNLLLCNLRDGRGNETLDWWPCKLRKIWRHMIDYYGYATSINSWLHVRCVIGWLDGIGGGAPCQFFFKFQFQLITAHRVGEQCSNVFVSNNVAVSYQNYTRKECIGGESNPGLPRGRREFYHWTNNA